MSRFRYLHCSDPRPNRKLFANFALCCCRGEQIGKWSQKRVTFGAGAFQRKVTEQGRDTTLSSLNIVMLSTHETTAEAQAEEG